MLVATDRHLTSPAAAKFVAASAWGRAMTQITLGGNTRALAWRRMR
jgi:hypothetical protein